MTRPETISRMITPEQVELQQYTIELWSGELRCDLYFSPRDIFEVMKEIMFWVDKPGIAIKVGYFEEDEE